MNFPSYYTVLDMTEGLVSRVKAKFAKKDPMAERPVHAARDRIFQEALERYDNIVGRFDTTNRVESRELMPPADGDDAEMMRLRGAVETEDGQWIVPDSIEDLEPFAAWWPEVDEDLRDETPRWLLTRNGKSVESYTTVEDRARGDDSTATVLVYGGFVGVAALCYFLFQVSPWFGWPALLLFIPFTVAMSHAEGPGEAAKCLALLGLGPMALAMGMNFGAKMPSETGGLLAIFGGGAMALMALPAFLLGALIIAFVATGMDKNQKESLVGGTFARLKAILWWAGVYLAAFILLGVLPAAVKPVVPFLLGSLYPMVYANVNFVKRGKLLKIQGMDLEANLGTQGALAQAHIEPKKRQAARALKDKSPKFVVGTSTGVMTAKHLPDAPDAGKAMVLTANDLSQHMLVFGETGSGKTDTQAKKIAAQWVASGAGGMLVLDGKGALPGDLRDLIDVMIEPGIEFNPYEGLDGHGIATAYIAVASANGGAKEHRIWENGADQFMIRSCKLFDALSNHERAYKSHAAEMAQLKELDIDRGMLELQRLALLGEDDAAVREQLALDQEEHDDWATIRDTPRKWLWNVDTHVKVMEMMNVVVHTSDGRKTPGELFRKSMAWLGHGVSPAVRAANPAKYHPEIGTGGLLDGAISYVENTWLGTFEDQQRSSFYLNVAARVLPLTTDPYTVSAKGVHWKSIEHGVDVTVCLRGQNVGVYLPEEKHPSSGQVISALIKQRVFGSVALRGGDNRDWAKNGETPVLVVMDEFQDLVSDTERNLLPKARSLGMKALFLTQEIDAVINKFGEDTKAYQFCNTFQSVVCLRSSAATHEYMNKRLGVAPLVKFKQPTRGLDYKAAVGKLANSPLNDVNHPNRAVMRKIERAGVGFMFRSNTGGPTWGGPRIANPEDMDVARGIVVPMGGQLEEGPLLSPAEHSTLIRFGRAIAMIRRAGEPRIDVIDTLVVTKEEMDAAIAARLKRNAEREAAQAA